MKILLDAHLPSAVARELWRHGVDVVTLAEWHGGIHRTVSDATIIQAAWEDERVLVTYDAVTIRPLLRNLGEAQKSHGGVVGLGPTRSGSIPNRHRRGRIGSLGLGFNRVGFCRANPPDAEADRENEDDDRG